MSKNKTRTKDKYRVVYNDTQRIELENEFRLNEYIAIPRKQEIAQKLQLSERQIKIWFQNRRAKKRKQQKRRQTSASSNSNSTSQEQPDFNQQQEQHERHYQALYGLSGDSDDGHGQQHHHHNHQQQHQQHHQQAHKQAQQHLELFQQQQQQHHHQPVVGTMAAHQAAAAAAAAATPTPVGVPCWPASLSQSTSPHMATLPGPTVGQFHLGTPPARAPAQAAQQQQSQPSLEGPAAAYANHHAQNGPVSNTYANNGYHHPTLHQHYIQSSPPLTHQQHQQQAVGQLAGQLNQHPHHPHHHHHHPHLHQHQNHHHTIMHPAAQLPEDVYGSHPHLHQQQQQHLQQQHHQHQHHHQQVSLLPNQQHHHQHHVSSYDQFSHHGASDTQGIISTDSKQTVATTSPPNLHHGPTQIGGHQTSQIRHYSTPQSSPPSQHNTNNKILQTSTARSIVSNAIALNTRPLLAAQTANSSSKPHLNLMPSSGATINVTQSQQFCRRQSTSLASTNSVSSNLSDHHSPIDSPTSSSVPSAASFGY